MLLFFFCFFFRECKLLVLCFRVRALGLFVRMSVGGRAKAFNRAACVFALAWPKGTSCPERAKKKKKNPWQQGSSD